MKNHNSTSRRTSVACITAILLVICMFAMTACKKKESKSRLNGPSSSESSAVDDTLPSDSTDVSDTSSDVSNSTDETTLASDSTSATETSETTDTTPASSETEPPETTTAAPTNTPTPKPTKAPTKAPTPTPKPKENTPTPVPQETTPAPTAQETTPAPKPSTGGNATSASAQAVLDILNAKRAELGVAPLTLNETMNKAARVRANELAESFGHTRPNGQKGTKALVEQGLSYSSAAECIGSGQSSASEIANDWLNSSGHYSKIVDAKYTKAGIANNGTYWELLLMN